MERVACFGLVASFLVLVAWAGVVAFLGDSAPSLGSCLLKAGAGLPCPTCGITRFTAALWAGEPLAALAWHPVGPALLLAAGWLAWSGARALWTGVPLSLGRSEALGLLLLGALGWGAKLASPPALW